MWKAQATGQLPRPISIQSIKLDPAQVDRLKTGKIRSLDSYMYNFHLLFETQV